MLARIHFACFFSLLSLLAGSPAARGQAPTVPARYDSTVAALARHPLPAWFADAKLGIFVHWGLYSVPGWARGTKTPMKQIFATTAGQEWFAHNPYAEWYLNSLRVPGSSTQAYHRATYGANFTYDDFVPIFNQQAAKWQPAAWAKLFRDVGAKYVVLTTKHHDGFLLWPSEHPNPFKKNYQAQRDIVGELSRAVTAQGLQMGLYYSSGLDWTFSPQPVATLADLGPSTPQQPEYATYLARHWRELMRRYHPAVLWADIGSPKAYNPLPVLAEFYNQNPLGVVNDRHAPGSAVPAAPFDYTTPEYQVLDSITAKKWEACRGIGLSFGYNRTEDAATFLSVDALIDSFIDIVSKNGNLLLNVGPEADGTIPAGQLSRLRGLGDWLHANGEAIYGTRPWTRASAQTTTGGRVRFTRKKNVVYLFLLDEPKGRTVSIPGVAWPSLKAVTSLRGRQPVPHRLTGQTLTLTLPAGAPKSSAYAFRLN